MKKIQDVETEILTMLKNNEEDYQCILTRALNTLKDGQPPIHSIKSESI